MDNKTPQIARYTIENINKNLPLHLPKNFAFSFFAED